MLHNPTVMKSKLNTEGRNGESPTAEGGNAQIIIKKAFIITIKAFQ